MSAGKRPTASGSDGPASVRGASPPARAFSAREADDEPPSGVVLRCDLLADVPRLAVTTAALKELPLDHRAGFIVSFIDGKFTVEMILDACAMKREDALAILRDLVARGIVTMAPRAGE